MSVLLSVVFQIINTQDITQSHPGFFKKSFFKSGKRNELNRTDRFAMRTQHQSFVSGDLTRLINQE